MENILDIAIIGAGPIGLACGIEATKAQLSYRIFDKGCLVNSLYRYPLNMTFFSTSEKLEIGDVPFVSHRYKPNRDEALEYYRRVAQKWNLSLSLYTGIRSIRKENDFFELETDRNEVWRCRNVIIATGFFDIANRMNIPGEDLPHVHHYFKEAHPFSYGRVAVIGCANSAIDAALECYRKGAEVTLIVRDQAISERVKYWVKPDIENRISEGSIRAFFRSRPIEIHPTYLLIETQDGLHKLPCDHILAMTGYQPDFGFLRSAGIGLEGPRQIPLCNPETMETNIPGIYLAGVVCGGMETHKWFIENSRVHAEMIVRHIKSSGQ